MRALLVASDARPALAENDRAASFERGPLALLGALGPTAVALALAVYFPIALFFLAPVVFGVPHVAADVRYLVLRRGLPSRWKHMVLLGCACLLGLRALDLIHPSPRTARVETLLATIWVLAAVAAAHSSQRTLWRASLAACAALGAGTLGLAWPAATRLILVHAHNLVALVAWGLVFRARPKMLLLYSTLILGAAGVLASGCLHRSTLASGSTLFGTHLLQIADWIAPGLRADRAIGLVSAYVFLQAVHYAIWLGVIPAQERRRSNGIALAGSPTSLRADFGRAGLFSVSVATLALLLGAGLQLQRSRFAYIALANFHVYLELVMLAYFWVRVGFAGEPEHGVEGGPKSP